MATQLDETFEDNGFFQQKLPQYYRAFLKDFRKITRFFVRFHLIFLLIFSAEVFLICTSLPFWSKSPLFACSIGALFLSCFSYFVLLFYYQSKKPEQLQSLKEKFITSCRQVLPVPKGEVEHHLSIADAMNKLADYLDDFEKDIYRVPSPFKSVTKPLTQGFSVYFKEDVYKMKLLLFQGSVDEHIEQIKITPTDLEVHASLANTYVRFSKVYEKHEDDAGFERCAKLAVQELCVLNDYAPQDPWICEQLAYGYKELGMVEEEREQIEKLLDLRPLDKDVLYRLGTLYFDQGMRAKGLQTYEKLKKIHIKKAENLLCHYGSVR